MNVRPLGGAVALVLLIAGGSWVLAMAKHHNPGSSAQKATPTPWPIITAEPETPSPSPPPTAPPSPPPPGVELLWRTVPSADDRLEAIDWSGQVRGGLVLPADRSHLGVVPPSRDGQRLLVKFNGAAQVISAQGRTLWSMPLPGDQTFDDIAWSDDNDHLCDVRSSAHLSGGASAQVFAIALGTPPRQVTSLQWAGNSGPRLLVCSVKLDVAVIMVVGGDDAAGHVIEIKTVRLSTGATIRDVHPPGFDPRSGNLLRPLPGTLSTASASLDGHLLALSGWTPPDGRAAPTDIVDTLSGRKLGHVDADVQGFSGDGAAILVNDGLLNWQTGRTVRAPAGCCGRLLEVRMGKPDMVVSVATGPVPTGGTSPNSPSPPPPPDDILVLRPDGTTLRLACCGDIVL